MGLAWEQATVGIAAGDESSRFRAAFAAHYGAVHAYASRRLPDVADDIAAEIFTVAWRRIADLPPEPDTLPWLYGVARRVTANARRSHRRRRRLEARLAAEPGPAQARPAEAHSGAGDVMAALRRLRPGDQEVLRLAAWEALRPAQIAKVLGCSANAAAIRLHRARRRLAKELAAAGHERFGRDT